jgi:DNA-binding GntR family transcriptional regulator
MPVERIGTRPSLTDLAYEALVEAIYDRTYPPGEPVSIDDLAERLGISVTPVREALVRATSQRLLTRESNKGFRVAPLLTQGDYRRLVELRRLLEVHAAATAELDREDVERLAEALERMQTAGSSSEYADVRGFTRADNDFHATLVEACGNEFVVAAWSNLHHIMHVHRIYVDSGIFDSRDAINEHTKILKAARAGDRDRLVEALRRHLDAAERRLAGSFPPSGDGP